MHDISAEEGLVALAYEKKHQQWRYVRREAWDIVEGTMHIGGEIFVCKLSVLHKQAISDM